MDLYSRNIKFEEFEALCRQIPGADLLIPERGTLTIKGIARGSFFRGNCFSLHGVYPLPNTKIGNAWMISHASLLKKYPLVPHRSAKQVIRDSFRDFSYDAVYIQVPDDFHVRWCESIGFTFVKKENNKVSLMILK